MDLEELQKLIQKIKNEKLRDYLLTNLSDESKLNFLSTTPPLIEKATQRFKNKIKVCEHIERDFPEELIPVGEAYLLSKKLDALRLSLARFNANKMQTEDEYNQIKTFIFKFLNFQNFHIKLKVFDLTIKLLEEIFNSYELKKDFLDVLGLLKLLVIDPHAFKSEHLKSINNLSGKDVKKDFYGIVYELNKKLFFEELLNILLEKIETIKKNDNSLLMQFNYKFIICCIEDQKMDADDFYQLITLVFQSLKDYESVSKHLAFSNFKNIWPKKNLGNYLVEFEKEFKERMPQIKLELGKSKLDLKTIDKIQESDISIYFPHSIKNKILNGKFNETKSKILKENEQEKENTKGNVISNNFWERVGDLSSKVDGLKTIATKNLKEIVGTTTEKIKEFKIKKSEDPSEENTNIVENAHKQSLMLELVDIKKNLNEWNLTLRRYNEQCNNIDTVSIDLDLSPEFLINALRLNIEEEFNDLISQTIKEFEEINTKIKEKGYWQLKLESDKSNFSKKLLQRGYFSIDFSIKKIKAKLGETPSFSIITDFILQQGFWALLFSFGIVRWPWMDKVAFAHSWSEQLCLPEILSETEKLKTSECNEVYLKKVITLSEEFFPHKNQAIVQSLTNFKSYIDITIVKLEAITKKIEENLSENNYATSSDNPVNIGSPTKRLFDKKFITSNFDDSRADIRITLATN